MEFLGLQTSHGPWTLFWGVQVLGPVTLVRAGARSPGAHPQHHIFRCSPIATQWAERASSFPEWGYRVTYPAFPFFCQSCDSAPFFPLWQVFCLIHVCHFHFTLTWEKGRKCLHWQNIAAEFWVSVCAQSGRDGKQPYHRLPCGHREVVHSYLGWLLNNLVPARIKNFFLTALFVCLGDVCSRRMMWVIAVAEATVRMAKKGDKKKLFYKTWLDEILLMNIRR